MRGWIGVLCGVVWLAVAVQAQTQDANTTVLVASTRPNDLYDVSYEPAQSSVKTIKGVRVKDVVKLGSREFLNLEIPRQNEPPQKAMIALESVRAILPSEGDPLQPRSGASTRPQPLQ